MTMPRFRLFLIVVVMAVSTGAYGMFDFMKVYLFSAMKGVVTLEGKPIAGAEIVRTAQYNDKTFADTTATDANGQFVIGPMQTSSINKIVMFAEAVIDQKILIHYQDRTYTAWRTVKRDYDKDTELGDGTSIELSCELTRKETKKRV